MSSYHQRLQIEMARRDAALMNMTAGGKASTAIVNEAIDRTRTLVSDEIHNAHEAVRCEIDHVRDSVSSQVDEWTTKLNPAQIIQAHPWGAMVGALAIGVVLVPLIKSQYAAPAKQIAAAPPANGHTNGREAGRDSKWKPLTDALMDNLPAIVAALLKFQAEQSAKRQKIEPCIAKAPVGSPHNR